MEMFMENNWGYFLLNESNKSKHKKKMIAFKKHNYVNTVVKLTVTSSLTLYDNVIFWWVFLRDTKKNWSSRDWRNSGSVYSWSGICVAWYRVQPWQPRTLQLHPWKWNGRFTWEYGIHPWKFGKSSSSTKPSFFQVLYMLIFRGVIFQIVIHEKGSDISPLPTTLFVPSRLQVWQWRQGWEGEGNL